MDSTGLMNLPWVFSGLIFIAGFTLLMLLVLLLTRSYVSAKTLKSCHDVAGFTFGIIGVIYGVLLGFTVVEVNNRYHLAEANILEEAALMMELFRDAGVFPAEQKKQIQLNMRAYAQSVYEDEWPLMARGKESPKSREAMLAIWNTYQSMNLLSDKERIWYELSLQKLNDLSQYRVLRFFHGHQSLGSLMWTLLILGAITTVLFMCFFSPDSILVQVTMMSLLSGTIAFMLFFILSLDGIYTGAVRLRPTELQTVIEKFDESLQESDYSRSSF